MREQNGHIHTKRGAKRGAEDRKLLTCGACQGRFYCDSQCQKADWKTHKLVCQRNEKKPHVPKHPDLVNAAQKWLEDHATAVRQYAIQCSGILPLDTAVQITKPTHHTVISLCEGFIPGDLLIVVTYRMPLDMHYEMTPAAEVNNWSYLQEAKAIPGCRGVAPYTVIVDGTMMPFHAYATVEECQKLPIEDVTTWKGSTYQAYLEKLLTKESGGRRNIWSAIHSIPLGLKK